MPKIFAFFSKSGLPALLGFVLGLIAEGAGAGFLPLGPCTSWVGRWGDGGEFWV